MAVELELERMFDRLWPICRSITGDGVRETLKIVGEMIPLEIFEEPSGKQVFDWTIPKEWNISGGVLTTEDGEVIVDWRKNNLHVASYSVPVDRTMSYDELEPHLHYIKDMPNAIPYVTTYYKETWGICLSYDQFRKLDKKRKYRVKIDATLREGSMTWAHCVIPGKTTREILFTTYICHPSMANNELSGILVASFLYRLVSAMPDRRYTYRFVFVPETIGSINYLSKFGSHLTTHLEAGFVVTCVGDAGSFHLKQSRSEAYRVNALAEHVLRFSGHSYHVLPFSPLGSDERQYCSPGFNLPVAVLTRSIFHKYREYHTSLDNKDFISFPSMRETIDLYGTICRALELNRHYKRTDPFCEPQLGKRGLYSQTGGLRNHPKTLLRMMSVLNYSDGEHDLLDIATRNGDSIFDYEQITAELEEKELIYPI